MRFFKEVFRAIKQPESEIRDHATVAATIAAVLAGVDYINHHGLRSLWNDGWEAGGELILTFLAAYFLMIAIEIVWVRMPVRLGRVGKLDGYWIYMTQDMEEPGFHGGSTLEIHSMGLGFEIEGFSWRWEPARPGDPQYELKECGDFYASGVEWTDDRIHYAYRGKEEGEVDTGVGFYSFTRKPGSTSIDGRFTGSRLGPDLRTVTRRLEGYQVFAKGDRGISGKSKDEIYKLLRQALRTELENAGSNLAYEFKHAGRVDGRWVDAIYERVADTNGDRWKLLEGSLIEISSSAEARRFYVNGWTFKWEDLRNGAADLSRVTNRYHFRADGRIAEHADGFYYNYVGFGGSHGSGAGYYYFAPKEATGGHTTEFRGAFLMGLSDRARVVYGRRVEVDRGNLLEWKTKLHEHLARFEQGPPF